MSMNKLKLGIIGKALLAPVSNGFDLNVYPTVCGGLIRRQHN